MIVITGLGRAGTSILTKYFKEIGFGIGKNVNWHENVRAGYELSTFYTLIHDFYHRYCKHGLSINLEDECWGDYWKGYTYREALTNVDKDDRQGMIDVIKDPRITWHPDIIKALWEVRPDLKLIICHRKTEDIYKSRKSLPEQYDDPKPRKTLEEYKIDFTSFYDEVLQLKIPHTILFFPHFLKYFNVTYSKLRDFVPHDYFVGKDKWEEIIDKELIK